MRVTNETFVYLLRVRERVLLNIIITDTSNALPLAALSSSSPNNLISPTSFLTFHLINPLLHTFTSNHNLLLSSFNTKKYTSVQRSISLLVSFSFFTNSAQEI